MAGDSKNDGEDVTGAVSSTSTETEMKSTKKKKKGFLSRTFNALFRSRKDDYEKRLEHISKEETAVLTRKRKRAQNWRRIVRNFILLSVLLEVVAVIYAIVTTRTVEMHWKIRAFKVLPMFLLPGLSYFIHSALSSLNKMFDNKDEKTLERLRSERQAKINELKEKTNYYITQQLIQRYDTDPAAKAAAATVLASKLGADSGLKFYMGDDLKSNSTGDMDMAVSSNGLRNRKKGQAGRANSIDTALIHHRSHEEDEMLNQTTAFEGSGDVSQYQEQLMVEHYPQTGTNASDGGWLARIAAMLVGEDPTQSYALICGNCHMHNGLARKEDFPYITYYCPHCNSLNKPKQTDERISQSNSPHLSSKQTDERISQSNSPHLSSKQTDERISQSNSPHLSSKQTDERISQSNSPHLSSSSTNAAAAADTDTIKTPGGGGGGGGSVVEPPLSPPSATDNTPLIAAATTESSGGSSDDLIVG